LSQSISKFYFNVENAKNAEKRRDIYSSLRTFAGSAASALKVLSYLYRHARIANARPRQTVERGHGVRHFIEQTFNG
jgi:ATP-dependent protease HslVU (ClpYQ) peptidase subunit